jgi:hypothetical protein
VCVWESVEVFGCFITACPHIFDIDRQSVGEQG